MTGILRRKRNLATDMVRGKVIQRKKVKMTINKPKREF
jgi:hypothetical protein